MVVYCTSFIPSGLMAELCMSSVFSVELCLDRTSTNRLPVSSEKSFYTENVLEGCISQYIRLLYCGGCMSPNTLCFCIRGMHLLMH